MRILYLCPSRHLGVRDRSGWSTHMTAVIRALRALGHAVYPYLAGNGRPLTPPRPFAGIRALAPAALRRARRDLGELAHDWRLSGQLPPVAREFEPEVIYERTDIYHTAGVRLARRLKLPLVVEVNGPLVDERIAWSGLLMPGYARRLEALKYRAADGVVAVSTALSGYLAAQGVDPARIHAIPNGADTTLFSPERAHPEAVRQKFGLGRRLVIGFAGAFADWHSLETLITATGELVSQCGLDAHLLMVGDGPGRLALRELAGQVGLDGRASLPGSVPHDQVPHYLAAMDLCVLPAANWYMSPIKLFEYGAMGRAVIAPATPAVAEVMTDGEDGLLIPPGSHEALVRAIAHLARCPEERARLGAAFQQRVRRRHTWMAVAERVSHILEQSLRERGLDAAPDAT